MYINETLKIRLSSLTKNFNELNELLKELKSSRNLSNNILEKKQLDRQIEDREILLKNYENEINEINEINNKLNPENKMPNLISTLEGNRISKVYSILEDGFSHSELQTFTITSLSDEVRKAIDGQNKQQIIQSIIRIYNSRLEAYKLLYFLKKERVELFKKYLGNLNPNWVPDEDIVSVDDENVTTTDSENTIPNGPQFKETYNGYIIDKHNSICLKYDTEDEEFILISLNPYMHLGISGKFYEVVLEFFQKSGISLNTVISRLTAYENLKIVSVDQNIEGEAYILSANNITMSYSTIYEKGQVIDHISKKDVTIDSFWETVATFCHHSEISILEAFKSLEENNIIYFPFLED